MQHDQVLLGHERNRKLGYILPLRNAAIFRVFDDAGRRVSVVASSQASDVFRALMTNAPAAPAVGGESLTEARERAMVEYIHDYTRRGELNDLRVAFEWDSTWAVSGDCPRGEIPPAIRVVLQ